MKFTRMLTFSRWVTLFIGLSSLMVLTSLHAAPGNKLGYNTSGLHHLASANPFIDIFKISRGWITSCEFDWQRNRPIDPGCTRQRSFNTKESALVQVDANGWPIRLPARGNDLFIPP